MSTTNSRGIDKYNDESEHIELPFQVAVSSTHKPRTLSQRRASAENFALRQLAGMAGNLAHLRGIVPDSVIKTITHATARGIECIKADQWNRKKYRLEKELEVVNKLIYNNSKAPV